MSGVNILRSVEASVRGILPDDRCVMRFFRMAAPVFVLGGSLCLRFGLGAPE